MNTPPLPQHESAWRILVPSYVATTGRYTARSFVQPLNAVSTIVIVLLQLTCTVVSDRQLRKVLSEIDATLSGIAIDLRPEDENVDGSMVCNTEPLANVTANLGDVHD